MKTSLLAVLLLLSGPAVAQPAAPAAPLWLWLLLVLAGVVIVVQGLLWRRASRRQPVLPVAEQLPAELLFDDISGLPNKWLARQTFLHQRQRSVVLALLVVKIDGFHKVNEVLGYSHANLVLSQIAQRLNLLASQFGGVVALGAGQQWVAHLGGVDFLLLVDQQGKQHQAGYLAHQLEHQLAEPMLLRGAAVSYQVQCGIAVAPEHGSEFADLLEKAYLALQHHQQSPTVPALYQAEMSAINPQKLAMMAQLQQSIALGQLQLDVQPQVLLPHRQVVAAEVLLRWAHPQQGLLAPKQFIPLAAEMGLMFPLTCWVLEQSIALLATLQAEGSAVQLAVNISSTDLLEIELVEQIQQLLEKYQVKPGLLILELKEDALMQRPQAVLPMLERLRALGLTLVLDDFGTGYTSLGMLRQLPLQQVKIDAQFISGMHRSDAQLAITGAIIDLARNLQLTVVAEGVEEQAVAEKLYRMGCLRAQGFLFTQPFALAGLPAWLRQHQFSSGQPEQPGLY